MARRAVKIIVVDTNTFIAAGWRINAHARRVFAAAARRRFRLAVSSDILEEYRGVSQWPRFSGKNYSGLLAWIEKYALVVEPVPLGKAHSRDPKDDIFLACALSANAKFIVSSDQELLKLGKPFGIEIVQPAYFIARHKL
jgi:putative PIN family toxin of toxin-antitoxin system